MAITQSISEITPLGNFLSPNRPAEVDNLVENELPQLTTELISLIPQINQSNTEANTSASTATTKASEAATSAASALSSKNSAATSASTATTKATEAAASATSAATSATNAQAYANSINPSLLATKEYVTSVNKKRRNYLINGNFQFWDYASSQTSAGYGSDNRWANEGIGSTKINSRMTSGDTERAFFESSYYSRTVVSSVVGSGNFLAKLQRIEDITKLAGKTVTLSFWAKADSAKNIAIEFLQNFGTGGSPSAVVYAINPTIINLTTTWKKYSVTTTLPSLVGKTLGTDGVHTSYTSSNFWFDAGSNYNSRTNNLGQQSGTFDIAEVKLEDGSVATDGWAPYDGEWGSEAIARMRYCREVRSRVVFSASSAGMYVSDSINLIPGMRVTPSIGEVVYASGNVGSTAITVNSSTSLCRQIASASVGVIDSDILYKLSAEL